MKTITTYTIVNEEGLKYNDGIEKFVSDLSWHKGCQDLDWLEECMSHMQQTFPNEKFEIVVHHIHKF